MVSEIEQTAKFWVLNDFEQYMLLKGLSLPLSDLITFTIAVLILVAILWLLDRIGSIIIIRIIHKAVKQTKTQLDDFLVNRHFFRRSVKFILILVLVFGIEEIFIGYSNFVVNLMLKLTKCVAVLYVLMTASSFLNAIQDLYQTLPQSKEKSIKGYLQTIKIILFLVATLFILSFVFGVEISKMLVGLATSAAILTLVFKDTILGFIASIQLSVQDIVRLGDWVQMDSKGVNGNVIDMSVTTVKVRNWDNTISMIPIYSMVSESFINWRGMEHSKGRRFTRPLLIDANSVSILSPKKIEALKNDPMLDDLIEEILTDPTVINQRNKTNLAFYRSYIELYLRKNPVINTSLALVVRHLPMKDYGIVIELYGFTKEKGFIEQEVLLNQIMEEVIAASKLFDIRFYQRNSGYNL